MLAFQIMIERLVAPEGVCFDLQRGVQCEKRGAEVSFPVLEDERVHTVSDARLRADHVLRHLLVPRPHGRQGAVERLPPGAVKQAPALGVRVVLLGVGLDEGVNQ